jgi:hypothetical protein
MSYGKELDRFGIDQYLQRYGDREMLRLLTCGSVDDGKSTLIGRLLYDSQVVFDDVLAATKKASDRFGTTGSELDLALLVDGLQAEREQGITIDVAYRYFATERRKFIIADTPGHGRRPSRGAGADLPAFVPLLAAGDSAFCHRHQQDGSGGLERAAVRRDPRCLWGFCLSPGRSGHPLHPDVGIVRR